ncbi:WYL domain-containing protein [Gelidibacter salicanalis]|uniref:WYL domain-containing protein n=1 Tax=Gelidibacter salicanalis TaxID=291193 RepID=A0A5C7AJP5_9FLAO|nr:WYL domain-containing protein [Gelidibacter salicanalis]TXE08557.1 WYL domain-containing protein [Gelidibacter salicanalis]
MSITKHAIIRYQVLDRCFRNPGKQYNIEDLLEECNDALSEFDPKTNGIQKRQLYEDINFMQSEHGWSVPIVKTKRGRTVYYQYDDLNFSINNQPLNQMEAEQLKSAMMVLGRFKGLPQFEWIEELLPKLDQTFSLSKQSEKVMSFDNNEYLKGIEHLSELFNAIIYNKTLLIQYHSFKSEQPNSVIFHPYHLKQYNKRWFLFGKNQHFENLTNLALDRIDSIEQAGEKFVPNSIVDFEEYFDDVIGVTIPEDNSITKIELIANPGLAPYIKTKPLHGSQKTIIEDDKGYTFSIEVFLNRELESVILGFGENIRVISPIDFKELLTHRIQQNLNNYN